ncbi:hypothetical protein [Syntrophorhabdus aromaticivorans]|uniref:Uncharacterized protein n=1 Tax=Syntrophorhabdus aromaticivorans TaxID=328301 RepID=A0A351U1H8_9BACT|nr:hypothetical protein [Syntrophorhabdus aromaticivorans]NLW35926.1 hypothetical protein [Syntrophorhabdus aromaticivorans]HBA53809.1 hypothetical protein [Syntrophorhabdus aromaticivorans]
MQLVEKNSKPAVSVEELLTLMQTKKQESEPKAVGQVRTVLWNLPFGAIILGALIVALGIMISVVKSDTSVLKNDMAELKSLRTQVAVMEPRQQPTTIEAMVEEARRDREILKGELTQLRAELDSLKSERKKGSDKKG